MWPHESYQQFRRSWGLICRHQFAVYLHKGTEALDMSTSVVSPFWQKKSSETLLRMAEEARLAGVRARLTDAQGGTDFHASLSRSDRRANLFAKFRTVADLASNSDQSYEECVRALEKLQMDLERGIPVVEAASVGASGVRNPLPSSDRSRVRKPNKGAPTKTAKKPERK